MGYFSRTKKSCISVFYIRTKFQISPYNNKHFRILGGTIPLNTKKVLRVLGCAKLIIMILLAPTNKLKLLIINRIIWLQDPVAETVTRVLCCRGRLLLQHPFK